MHREKFLLKSSWAVNFFQWQLHYHTDWLFKKERERDKKKKKEKLLCQGPAPADPGYSKRGQCRQLI